MSKYPDFKGKRLGAIDFGRKRVGFAVCDEFHITVNPRKFYLFDSISFWDDLLNDLKKENLSAVIVGVPYRLDNQETDVIKSIKEFIDELKNKSGLEIIPFDESFSSKKAMKTMIEIGYKKKKRAQKGNTDQIAAAVILRDFLKELELL